MHAIAIVITLSLLALVLGVIFDILYREKLRIISALMGRGAGDTVTHTTNILTLKRAANDDSRSGSVTWPKVA